MSWPPTTLHSRGDIIYIGGRGVWVIRYGYGIRGYSNGYKYEGYMVLRVWNKGILSTMGM